MSAVTILPHQRAAVAVVFCRVPRFRRAASSDPILTKEEIRHYQNNDLLQLIALTDAVMYKRLLTDNEKHNFWLVIDERRERASVKQST